MLWVKSLAQQRQHGGGPSSLSPLASVGCSVSQERPASRSACHPCAVVLREMQTAWPSAVGQGFSTWVLRIQGSRDLVREKNIFPTNFCLKI